MPDDTRAATLGINCFNLQRVAAGHFDVVDWPEPGGWPGRVVRLDGRWWPQRRTPAGTAEPLFVPVGRRSYRTMRRAARGLIKAVRDAD